MRIMVATDGSPHARRACAFAVDLAARYGAPLIAVHVAVPGTFLDGVDLAALEADGSVLVSRGEPAERIAAAILSTPLGAELVVEDDHVD